MLDAGKGLTEVKTGALVALLRAVHRGDVTCPLSVEDLTRVGLQYCATELLGHLRGLDKRGVSAVVVAVIAERRAR